MRKIPTLFVRDPATNLRYLTREVTEGCQWVLDGEGRATYKWNGTAILIDAQRAVWTRRTVKPGQDRPADFTEAGFDDTTGIAVGWVPVERGSPYAKALADAIPDDEARPDPGTYELVGPKVQGNPHGFSVHRLIRHGTDPVADTPRTYDDLAVWLHDGSHDTGFEGIVWHHDDGRMAKIKVRDFPEPEAQ